MKKFLSIILITVTTMAMGVSLASCEKEDYGYYDVEKHLFGEWESDSIQTNERNGIVWVSATDCAERQAFGQSLPHDCEAQGRQILSS